MEKLGVFKADARLSMTILTGNYLQLGEKKLNESGI